MMLTYFENEGKAIPMFTSGARDVTLSLKRLACFPNFLRIICQVRRLTHLTSTLTIDLDLDLDLILRTNLEVPL